MNDHDSRLIRLIQRTTRGGRVLLHSLAQHGKTLERDDPQRAALLLELIGPHPLYKGGRLTFDMLEIEDLILDGPPVASMSSAQIAECLRAVGGNTRDFIQVFLGVIPEPREGVRADTPSNGAASNGDMPRIRFGFTEQPRPPAGDGVRCTGEPAPELLSSDYLYDYVVLGFLDVLAGDIGGRDQNAIRGIKIGRTSRSS